MPRDEHELTIDQLAARAGMTVRTVRSHVTRRLLPSPRLVGRTAYYGDEHLARLELIATLQREGFNLGSIERLVRSVPFESSEQVLAFHRALVSPWLKEEPVELTHEELGRHLGLPVDTAVLARMEELRLLEPLDGDRVRVVNPALFRAGVQVIRLGMPAARVVEVEPEIRPHLRAVAQAFVELFRDGVWRGLVEAGMPADRVERAADTIRQLQPVAAQAVLAVFRQEMSEAISEALAQQPSPARSDETG
ncbi:MAG: MerR family transcriptional regulator [Actinomycetota bacterium]